MGDWWWPAHVQLHSWSWLGQSRPACAWLQSVQAAGTVLEACRRGKAGQDVRRRLAKQQMLQRV
jgi:hypothetical protein